MPRGMRWDATADVVVIGCGAAGAVAAMTAHDEGADVLILEKQPRESLCSNTSMSGAVFLCPSDPKSGFEYLKAVCRLDDGALWSDEEMIRVWSEHCAENKSWIESRGGSFLEKPHPAEYPDMPSHEGMIRYHLRGGGHGLVRLLSAQIKAKNIPVLYETAARKLLTNPSGRIVGVLAEDRSGDETRKVAIGASRGVILSCGGFEFNEVMKLNYLKVYPTYFTGSQANTGDGIRMALDVGADLWHMNCVSAWTVMRFPDFPVAFYLDFGPGTFLIRHGDAVKRCGYIFVDRGAARFTDENRLKSPSHGYYYELGFFDSRRLMHPRVPNYWVFDSRRMELGALPRRDAGPSGPSRLYEWSKDNSREIAKGWITTAKTVRDLGRALELSPDALQKTVSSYNSYCEKGADPDFGRSPSDLVPLDQPPYYAVKLWPGGANTQGGPRRNAKAEVLNPDGEPIPGLYSAGELGSIYGMLYPGAGNLGECVAFGRIAGQNAARRHPKRV
ncbi:MAG: FAD-binding protein [Chloroflexi bacterium]|nr:FAD-binding protein [Chloroflexota bacterium]